jgi:polyisoprenoid-binding protein YceI
MKHVFKKLSALSILSAAFILPAQAAPETYTIDNTHAAVTFHVSHFGFSNPSGKWMANGTLIFDEETPENSKVNVTINVADVVTGVPKLDAHLQKEDFFDTKTYPTATFVSDKVEIVKDDKGQPTKAAKVYGTLTIEGISKPIVLDMVLNKVGMSPILNVKTVGFSGTTTFKRSDFGIDTYVPGISDEVMIELEIEANKNAD